jgi:hypothetical protein
MNIPLSGHDKELFAKFKNLIPDDSDTISFMRNELFGSSFDGQPLKPLHAIRDNWKGAAFEFDNLEVNQAWITLNKRTEIFLGTLTRNTFPHPVLVKTHFFFGERTEEKEERINKISKKVNKLANQWLDAYNTFIRSYRVAQAKPATEAKPVSDRKVIIHSLGSDVQDGWAGMFCKDQYSPLVQIGIRGYAAYLKVIAWEKKEIFRERFNKSCEVTLYVVKGNSSTFQRTYSDSDSIMYVHFSYLTGLNNNIAIHNIYANKIIETRIGGIDDGKEIDSVIACGVKIRESTLEERAKLKDLFPSRFTTELVVEKDKMITKPACSVKPGQALPPEEVARRVAILNKDTYVEHLKPCNFEFCCELMSWEGKRHLCVGIDYSRKTVPSGWKESFRLLLTSLPPSAANRIIADFCVDVPEHGMITLSQPYAIDKNNMLTDIHGYKWKLESFAECRALTQEQDNLFNETFKPNTENKDTQSSNDPFQKVWPGGPLECIKWGRSFCFNKKYYEIGGDGTWKVLLQLAEGKGNFVSFGKKNIKSLFGRDKFKDFKEHIIPEGKGNLGTGRFKLQL